MITVWWWQELVLKHGHDHVVVPTAAMEADLPIAPLLHEAAGPIGSNRTDAGALAEITGKQRLGRTLDRLRRAGW